MIELHQADCLEIMLSMPDNSVDLILTDPPYYSTNLAFDKEPRIDFEYWLKECKRVLTPAGILVSFADFNLLAELRGHKVFKSAYELIWEKKLPTGFLDANKRPLRNHEFISVFTNQLRESTYNPQKWDSGIKKTSNRKCAAGHYNSHGDNYYHSEGERHPTSVLKFGNGNNNNQHPTQKPLELINWLINTYSNKGDLVIDCFMGSGTTGDACVKLKRNFIGIEKDAVYFSIAKARIEHTQHDLDVLFGEVA